MVGTSQLLLQLVQQGGPEVQQLLQQLASDLPELQQQVSSGCGCSLW